jgi:hypothetical protein
MFPAEDGNISSFRETASAVEYCRMESLWVPRRTVTYFYTWERKRFQKLYIVPTVRCLWSDHTIFSPTGAQYCVQIFCITVSCWVTRYCADPSGRAVSGLGLRPSACWDRGFESHRGHGCLSCTVFVLSSTGLCNGPIPRSEESYRLWCVSECDQVKIKTLSTYCEQVGRRGKDYEMKQDIVTPCYSTRYCTIEYLEAIDCTLLDWIWCIL